MNRFPAIGGLALLVWQMSLTASAQESGQLSPNVVKKIESAISGEMERQQIVGASVGLVIDSEIAFFRGFGFADREKEKPATSKTIYNWASNSKPVMAIAAMQLVEAGKLDLDADIRTYVPEFPEKNGVVTTRLLMCHQSGIPHYTNGRIVPLDTSEPDDPLAELDPVVALRRFGGSPLLYKPGEGFSYSSYAYVLLSAVVQRAGKQPIADQIDERILKKLELRSFQLDLPFDNQPEWTVAYFRNRQGEFYRVSDIAHFWKHGAGGYKSDIEDFARWAQALVNTELIATKSQEALWTIQSTADGKPTNFGLGFTISVPADKVLRVGHGGSQEETKTSMNLLPGKKQAIVVMCNTAHAVPNQIAKAVEEILDANGND